MFICTFPSFIYQLSDFSSGGFLAHSLAVMSDAAHLLTDFASFMISLMALYLVSRPSTKRLSFGWYRAGKVFMGMLGWGQPKLVHRVDCAGLKPSSLSLL